MPPGRVLVSPSLSLLITPATGRRAKKEDPGTALDTAAAVLSRLGSLRALAALTPKELMDTHGLGNASVARLCAIAELARRFTEEDERLAETLSGAEEAYRKLFRGSIHASSVHPREVVKEVLKEDAAAAVILAHNHPSGHPHLGYGRARGAG